MTAPTTTDHRRAAHRLWNVAALMLAATVALPIAALACADALQPGLGLGGTPPAGSGGGGGPGGGDGERRPERGGRPGERGGPNGQEGREGEPPSPQQIRANLQRMAERLRAAQGRLEKLIASFDNNELTPGEIPAEVEGILRTLRDMGSGQRGGGGRNIRPDGPDGPDGQDGADGLDGPGRPGGQGGLGGRPGGGGGGAGQGQQPGSLGGLFPSEPMRLLSPADRKAVRAIIAEHLPVLDREFEALTIKDDRMSERFIDALAPRVRPLPQLKKRDPELYSLHSEEVMNFVEVIRASKAIADARLAKDDAAKDNGRQALKAAIGRQVDTRLKIQDHQIGELRRRAETLQGELTKSKSNREKLVNDKFALAEREADRPRGPLDNKDRKPARRRDEQPGKQPGQQPGTPPDEAPTAEPKR